MNKKTMIVVVLFIFTLFLIPSSFALYKNYSDGSSSLVSAEWNVSLEQDGVNNSLTVVPGFATDTYTLNVKSISEVDVKYTINISNLLSGVEASLNGVDFYPEVNGTITFPDEFTILFNSLNKINTHTVTFRAANNATFVNNRQITANVIAKQMISS